MSEASKHKPPATEAASLQGTLGQSGPGGAFELAPGASLVVRDLGVMPYPDAIKQQHRSHARVLAARGAEGEAPGASSGVLIGELLLVEHPPVITVSRRPGAGAHLLASAELLASMGVTVHETDRGGDITYHGPGQLVVYPIVDLNRMHLRLHDYMRLLEAAVIGACGAMGVASQRDAGATGVWTVPTGEVASAKLCAMGVRVSRWVTLHGLALNVSTDLSFFDLIVPCGLAGREVTSLKQRLGAACPSMADVKATLARALASALASALVKQMEARSDGR